VTRKSSKTTAAFPDGAKFAVQMEDDQWMKDYDPDAFEGRGHVIVTRSVQHAKTFDNLNDAMNYCTRPNQTNRRPLIALPLKLARVR
jgi:repressor of nif and glnA expression